MLNTQFRRVRCRIPMNIQFFAAPEGGSGGGSGQGQDSSGQGQNGQDSGGQAQNQQPPQIDYAKIQQMLEGTLAAKEDTALKAYFKQQGLSQQEAEQAMSAFKAEKAKNNPDVAGLQAQIAQMQSAAREAQLDKEATLVAVGLGLDVKSIPYVLKMADFSQAAGQDGKISTDAVKNAISKVLEDVPALKPQAAGSTGFFQMGAGSGQNSTGAVDSELDRIFGVKKK